MMLGSREQGAGSRGFGEKVESENRKKIIESEAWSMGREERRINPTKSSLCNFKLAITIAIVLLTSIFIFTGCGGRQSANFIIIAGSTSVQPYVEILVEAYAHYYPEEEIDVQGGGSSAGIQAVESGTAEIGMLSRNLKESEIHLWSIEITKDGLAIIVNPDNPVGNLTLEQLGGVYAGEITNWSELGGLNARIHVITREEGSGTRGAFEEMVMDSRRISPRAIVQDSNGAVRQIVSGDQFSIGFISLGLVNIGERPVKALHIGGVTPSRENIINGSYTLFRSFLFVAKEEPTGEAMQFIDFILSPEGQQILVGEGLIPE